MSAFFPGVAPGILPLIQTKARKILPAQVEEVPLSHREVIRAEAIHQLTKLPLPD